MAIAVLDIVEFSTVDDNLGHPLGDALLRLVAERVRSAFGQPAPGCGLDDDRFSVMETDRPNGTDGGLAKRIADCFEAPFSLQGQELRVDARAGFVRFPDDGDRADPRHASVSLAKLRAAGVAIAIDDFGTGHSSLRVLAGADRPAAARASRRASGKAGR